MVTPLASRFAVLPVDDDGDTSRRITAKMLKKREEQAQKSQSSSGVNKKPGPDSKKKQNTKKKSDQSEKKPKAKTEASKKKSTQEQQWEQWKQKDAEFVDGNYEEDLHQAILESKLDYEEKAEYYDQIKKATEEEKKAGAKKNKKSNKSQTMSLSQFNQMGENRNQAETNGVNEKATDLVNGVAQEHDPKFFEKIKSEAKKALKSEQAEEQRKAREPLIEERISAARFQDRLEKCNEKIARLEEENKELKKKLKDVQARNTTFLQLLTQGEMKDKASVLLEVEDLKRVKDELSSEVSSLAAQLEQEKSKVRALTGGDARAKDKKKRTDSK